VKIGTVTSLPGDPGFEAVPTAIGWGRTGQKFVALQ
jgi:hypothetical protein